MRKNDTGKHKYYSLVQNSTSLEDAILSVGHLNYQKGDKHPLDFFPKDRQFLEHGGRSLKYYQLVYITAGQGWFKNSNIHHDVKSGDLFIIRPGVWHSYAPLKEIGWESYYVEFTGPILSNLIEKLIPGIEKDYINIGENREIIDIYEKLLEHAAAKEETSQLYLRAMVTLLITIIEKLIFPAPEDNFSNRARISQAISYLEEHLTEEIDIPKVAEDFNFSYSNFRRSFKSLTGISPMCFLKNLRIQRSKHLLLTTDQLVKQIALQCGFSSGEYFCNAFIKVIGMSPTEYRESKNHQL